MRLSWDSWKTSSSVTDWLPQRFLVSFFLFTSLCVSYVMRFSIGILLIDMAGPRENDFHGNGCDRGGKDGNSSVIRDFEFHWSESLQGWIMSSFFYSYVLGTLASVTLLSDVRHGKRILCFGMGGSTLSTLLTPFATRSNDLSGIICMRISLGLWQGLVYPAVHAVAALWIPDNERGRLGSIIFSGTCFGNVLTHICIGYFLDGNPGGWPAAFYVVGLIGLLWTVLFSVFVPKTPDYHEYLSDKEKEIFAIYKESANLKVNTMSAPWRQIVKSKPIWALTVASFGHDWAFFTVILDLPKYMSEVLRYSVGYNGLILGALYLSIILFAVVGGFSIDCFTGRTSVFGLTAARKLYNTVASLIPAVGLALLGVLGCDRADAVMSLFICFSFFGFFYPGIKINALELTPNHAGSVSSFVVALSATSGILAPHINGLLTPRGTFDEWQIVFYTAAAILAASNIIYLLMGSASVQNWNVIASAKPSRATIEKSELMKAEPSNIFISLFASSTDLKSKSSQFWSKAVVASQERLEEAANIFMTRRVSTSDVTGSAPRSDAVPGPSGAKSSVKALKETDSVGFIREIIDDSVEASTRNPEVNEILNKTHL